MNAPEKILPIPSVFPAALRRFAESLDYLRTYVDTIHKHLEDESQQILRDNMFALSPIVLHYVEKQLADPSSELSESDRKRYRTLIDKMAPMYEEYITVTDTEVTIHNTESRVGAAMGDAIKLQEANARKSVLFQDSAIVMLVGMVEVCVNSIVSLSYAMDPTIVDESNHTFTLAELSRFTEIADARTFLIEKRVSDSMYGGLLMWVDLLKSTYHIDAHYTDAFRKPLRELYLRRNVIAHSEGHAGKAYVAVVPSDDNGDPIRIGDRIFTSKTYLNEAVSMVETAFLLLGAEIWDRVTSGSQKDDIADFLGDATYSALREGRWATAIAFSRFVASDKKVGDTLRLMAQFNKWQGDKWSGNFATVEAEVRRLDYNALNLQFQLAWLALTDSADDFFPLLESALKIGKITSHQARDWPIFREMRKDARFKAALMEYGVESEVSRLDNAEMAKLLFASDMARKAKDEPRRLSATKLSGKLDSPDQLGTAPSINAKKQPTMRRPRKPKSS